MEKETQKFVNELNKEIILTHTITASRLLKKGKVGVEAFTLYNFYSWCASWQLTNSVKATDGFCMRGLFWGRRKFRRAKDLLLKEGIIEQKIVREKGKFEAHYIHIHFLNGFTSGIKNHTVVSSPCVEQTTNAYDKKVSALDKKEIVETQGVSGKEINDLIELFKSVNPTYERLFPNKNQRASLERLVKKFGREQVESMIKFLPKIFGKLYAPRITTPYALEKKIADLIAYVQSEKEKGGKVFTIKPIQK